LRTRLGANTEDLIHDELVAGECRVVSGSLLSGRRAATAESFLGRYHDQISVVPEGREERSRTGSLLRLSGGRSASSSRRAANWTTAMNGRPRAMLPLHIFEDVVPLRIPITLLLRSLAAGDLKAARAFGALSLEEEDLALCSYLCPSKLEYGELLRLALDELGATAP
jgi:Na+-transporting NADH:ubiquinone oxidoreductase subunit A